MASDIHLWVTDPGPLAGAKFEEAKQLFQRVESSCTRFDPESPLMQANRAGRRWHPVPRECADAIVAAELAHQITDGLFDPRVLKVLQSYGYAASLPFEAGPVRVAADSRSLKGLHWRRSRTWKPEVNRDRTAVRIGPVPIDLGGIGKGLAVRWAGELLRDAGSSVLIEAGGDCHAQGGGPDGDGWAIAVEDPTGAAEPIAVLKLTDRAVATSSTRLRRWQVGDRDVHHLIDPRTQQAAASDLVAVTVVDSDAAVAEVWSKALFVAGRAKIRALADEHHLAALWVDASGRTGGTRSMNTYVAWRAQRVV